MISALVVKATSVRSALEPRRPSDAGALRRDVLLRAARLIEVWAGSGPPNRRQLVSVAARKASSTESVWKNRSTRPG